MTIVLPAPIHQASPPVILATTFSTLVVMLVQPVLLTAVPALMELPAQLVSQVITLLAVPVQFAMPPQDLLPAMDLQLPSLAHRATISAIVVAKLAQV
jgi:hypothetical protein